MDQSTTEPLDEQRPLTYSFWAGALILRGSIAPLIFLDVLKFGLIAEAIVLISIAVENQWDVNLAVPHGPFSAAGALLGLMLVLRTNAGYDRWWESRKLWGGIVNQSRNLGVTAVSYSPEIAEWRSQFVLWAASFPHVIKRSLRNERVMPEVEQLIGPAKAAQVTKAKHMPTFVSNHLASMLQDAKNSGMDSYAFLQMEQQRGMIVDDLPIDAICHTIETNLLELLRTDPIVVKAGLEMQTLEITPELAAKIAKSNRSDTLIS